MCGLALVFLSVTDTTKVHNPEAVGFPEMTPAPEIFRPAGSAADPAARAHL